MKIAACLGCKDEIDLVGPAIAHLEAIGVDHIIAADSRSTDGTRDLLARRVGPGFELCDFDDLHPDPAYEAAETARIVARAAEVGADWLLFVDADEFPLPGPGSLKRLAGLTQADVLSIDRYNVPLLSQGLACTLPPADLGRVPLFAPDAGRQASQARVRKDAEAAWIAVIPAPKVMIRPDVVTITAEGGHDAGKDRPELRRRIAQDMVIAHVPFTTEARFARKVDNMRRAVAQVGDNWLAGSAWHWRRWLDNVDQRGGVAGEMARNRLTPEQMDTLRQGGQVKTAAEILARRQA